MAAARNKTITAIRALFGYAFLCNSNLPHPESDFI